LLFIELGKYSLIICLAAKRLLIAPSGKRGRGRGDGGGGTSLYPTLALRVIDSVVLRILAQDRPDRDHAFPDLVRQGGQRGFDPAGSSDIWRSHVSEPQCASLSTSLGLEDFQTNLIMPEPCPFLSRKFPVVSVIRPVSISTSIFGAMAAVKGLTDDGPRPIRRVLQDAA
jgi:hypothetical protein